MFPDTESQLEGIKEIFATAAKEDGWKVDEEMLYSFYFVDEDVDKLEKLVCPFTVILVAAGLV